LAKLLSAVAYTNCCVAYWQHRWEKIVNEITAHPAIFAIGSYWIFSAFVGGMPEPVTAFGTYAWLYNSLHILAGNITSAMQSKFPNLPAGATLATQLTTVATSAKESL
jgi:hypothetical protein